MVKLAFPELTLIGSFNGKNLYKATKQIENCVLSFIELDIFPKVFIRSKNSKIQSLAIGSLEKFNPDFILSNPINLDVNFYGFINFDKKNDSTWDGFDLPFFFIPEFEVICKDNTTCISTYSYNQNPKELLIDLTSTKESENKISFVSESPQYQDWESLVKKQTKDISAKRLKKVVLAKKESFETQYPINHKNTLQSLLKVPNTHAFAIILDQENGFFGASPETLYTKTNQTISTEAIASTRKRGNSLKEDLELEKQMLKSSKDLTEFSEVQTGIENSLNTLCSKVKRSPISVYKNTYVQHLRCEFKATTEASSFDIINSLHPTPAIGGFPKKEAVKRILELEPFSRRLYSSILGSKGKNKEEFIVAIRSFIVNKTLLTAFAGVGLVEKSEPEKEWQELSIKIESIIKGAGFEITRRNLCPLNH